MTTTTETRPGLGKRGPRGRWPDDAEALIGLLMAQESGAWFTAVNLRSILGLTVRQWQRAIGGLEGEVRRTYRSGGVPGGQHLIQAVRIWCPACPDVPDPECRRCRGIGTVENQQ